MTQPISVLSEGQLLTISSETESNANSKRKTNIDLSTKSFPDDQFYQQPAIFFYRNRIRVGFELKDGFANQFGLIRGLIEFYRSHRFRFVYDRERKYIETDIDESRLHEVTQFISLIHQTFARELRFKTALQEVIQFEQRYKAEAGKLYSVCTNI